MIVTAEDAVYNRYLNEKISITPEKTHCSFDVVFDDDMSIDLKFQLGSIGEASSAGSHTVTLSNITWE